MSTESENESKPEVKLNENQKWNWIQTGNEIECQPEVNENALKTQ